MWLITQALLVHILSLLRNTDRVIHFMSDAREILQRTLYLFIGIDQKKCSR